MPHIFHKLLQVLSALKNPKQQKQLIERVISESTDAQKIIDDNTISEEAKLDAVIDQIIASSAIAGQKQVFRNLGTAGRNQAKINSDNQAEVLAPKIRDLLEKGTNTLQGIADALNHERIPTKSGHIWYPATIKSLLIRIDAINDAGASRAVDNHTKSLIPIIDELEQKGVKTSQGIADALNEREAYTKTGSMWYARSVKVLLQKIKDLKQSNQIGI